MLYDILITTGCCAFINSDSIPPLQFEYRFLRTFSPTSTMSKLVITTTKNNKLQSVKLRLFLHRLIFFLNARYKPKTLISTVPNSSQPLQLQYPSLPRKTRRQHFNLKPDVTATLSTTASHSQFAANVITMSHQLITSGRRKRYLLFLYYDSDGTQNITLVSCHLSHYYTHSTHGLRTFFQKAYNMIFYRC